MSKYLLKFGGNALSGEGALDRLCSDIAEMLSHGHEVMVVHGGGPEISAEMERRGMEPRKVAGLRITDEATLEVAETVLRRINDSVVEALGRAGVSSIGMPAYMCSLCRRKDPVKVKDGDETVEVDLGLVGEVVDADLSSADDVIRATGGVPVLYPIGKDAEGRKLNINADTLASAVAVAWKCDEMVAITDVPGILRDVHDHDSKIDTITVDEVHALVEQGVISGGMIPKVEACIRALSAGVPKVRMVDGGDKEHIITESTNGRQKGTVITR